MTFKSIAEFLDPQNGHAPTPAELKLIAATQAGTPCILSETRPTEPADETRIRATLLRLLILGGTSECGLHESGVALVGGWIEGELDLAFCTAKGQTFLVFCSFSQRPVFFQASMSLLNLSDSHLPGMLAQGVCISGSLFLRHINSIGCVDINGARVGGQADFEKAELNGQSQEALNAQGIHIGSDLFLREVAASGTVNMNAAKVSGYLGCEKATFDGKGLAALNAQGLETGQVFSLGSLNAVGSVHFSGAKIRGQLICTEATFDGKGQEALVAQGVQIGQDLFFDRATVHGSVWLNGARINGQLSCIGASFNAMGKTAFQAQRAQVIQSFLFREVTGISGSIDLVAANVGDLVDDTQSWPQGPDQLILDGFTYDRVAGTAPVTFAARRAWLAAGSVWGGEFRPQPYTQLARVLRQMGHEGEARKVLIERTRLQGQYARAAREIVPNGDVDVGLRSIRASVINLAHLIFDRASLWVAGYGHAPIRSLGWLLGLFVAAWIIAGNTWATGAFAPNSDVLLTSPGWAQVTANDCQPKAFEGCDPNPAQTWANTFTASAATPTQGADWESFSAPAYALDLVVPILDLGQTDAWAPSKDRGPWGWLLWWSRWAFEALGWLVSGLGIAAVTGVMQRNQPD